MASPSPVSGYLSVQPKRTPKLTYRTKSDDASLSTTSSAPPVSPALTESCPSPRYAHSDTYSQLEGRQPSIAPSSLSSHAVDKTSKKKAGFFSGLFSVKEPSAKALSDYQKQMLKPEPSAHRGRSTAVGMGVSSAKLPPTVPKVNSKWDGIPEVAKEKEKKKQLAARASMSFASVSVKNADLTGSESSLRKSEARRSQSRGTLSGTSLHSTGSGNNLADLYGWEVTDYSSGRSSRDWAAEHRRPGTSRSGSSKSAPPLQHTSAFPSGMPEPPKIPITYLGDSATRPQGSPSAPDHSHSPGLTPYNSSPVTPDSPSPGKTLASPISTEDVIYDNLKTTTIEAPSSPEDVIIKSAGVGILAPPAAAKRRAKNTTIQPNAVRPNTSNSALGNTSEVTSGTEAPPQSPLPPRSGADGMRARSNSARDRLSLGMTLKHQGITPWGWSELHPEAQSVTNDAGTISPTPEEGSRRKRLTLFKK